MFRRISSRVRSGVSALTLALMLNGCGTPATVVTNVQQTQAQIQEGIQNACNDVNGAAALAAPFSAVPQVGAALTWATASCGTAAAIAALVTKAVNDPSTVTWAEGLASQISGDVAILKSAAS